MASSSPSGDDVLAQLKPLSPEEQLAQETRLNERIHRQFEKAQQRQYEAVSDNSTKPITISSIRLLGSPNTRHAFLARIFDPILSHNRPDQPTYTLRAALAEIGTAVTTLRKLGIYQDPISTYIDTPDPSDPSTTATDHAVFISAKERGRYTIKTGTEAGTLEGSAYANVVLRNLFGGAESLNANASLGTRTRSSYNAHFDTPILSNPDLRWEIGGQASSTLKPWASHEEVLRGGSTRLLWRTSEHSQHNFTYSGFWRQVTSLAEKASPTVRADAGDSFKSSLSHTFTRDTRDVPMLPSTGSLLRTTSELAGAGGLLGGDISFAKLELESQTALPVPIPGLSGASDSSGITFTTALRGGLLYPLGEEHSRLNDRFQLGGPTDVRGFRLSGLGPRDGGDAVGGDVYAAGGASLLFPVPRIGKETPLRFQIFLNGGRLLGLKDTSGSGESGEEGGRRGNVGESVAQTLAELGNGLPSTATGFGLVYAHPAARFEVNFSLPLVLRKGEEGRKGVSFGVGLSFL